VTAAYRPRPDRLWWARRPAYLAFTLRELTSVAVAWVIAYLLLLLWAAGHGAAEDFWDLARRPWMIALNLLALAATAFHSITWLGLASKATVVRLRGWRVPGGLIAAANYAAWAAVSLIIALLLLRPR
jgi:fumarate reductase subunit C